MEIKGAIHELELKPGTMAESVFVPMRSATYNLRCTVAGHTEAGMTGKIALAKLAEEDRLLTSVNTLTD